MARTSTISSKGQITVPLEIRNRLGLKKGDRVEFVVDVLRGRLISILGVEIGVETIHLDALERYRKTTVHLVDCLFAAPAAAEDTPVEIFDRDFRKFADVRVETQ